MDTGYQNNTITALLNQAGGAELEKTVFTQEYGLLLKLLRQIRSEQGLTQTQLAERLRETQSWVSKCERGEHRLDVIELRAFCQGLQTTLPEFIIRMEALLASEPHPAAR